MKIRDYKNLIRSNLLQKYRALFINRYKINGLEYGIDKYIMTTILDNATISGFKLATNEVVSLPGFAPYVVNGYTWSNSPAKFTPIVIHNSALIPRRALENDVEGVILQLEFNPMNIINEYVERIVDVESTIRTNLKTNKMPFIIRTTDTKTLKAIQDLLADEEVITLNDNSLQVLNTNVNYLVDKLQEYKTMVEAELLTILNIDNVKYEKKAQMNVDEINANNDEINAYANILEGKLRKFFDRMNELFGYNIQVEETRPVESVKETVDESIE